MYQPIKDFSIIYVLIAIGSLGIEYLTQPFGLDLYADIPPIIEIFSSIIVSIVFLVGPSAYVGMRYATLRENVPTPAQAWRLGICTFPVMLVVGLLSFIYLSYVDPNFLEISALGPASDELASSLALSELVEIMFMVAVLAVVFVLVFLTAVLLTHILSVRWIFPFAARHYLKKIERLNNTA